MAGRPSKLTREVEADLTLMLAQGVPVKLAAAATDVSPRSVRRWLHEGDLRERVAEVRATERATCRRDLRGAAGRPAPAGRDGLAGERLVAGAALPRTLGAAVKLK